MLYRRGEIWWYKFRFAGRVFRESSKTKSKTLARQAERKRHQSLEEAIHGIKKRVAPVTLSTAAAEWAKLKKPTLAEKSLRIEEVNLEKHLKPALGSMLLMDITADEVVGIRGVNDHELLGLARKGRLSVASWRCFGEWRGRAAR